MLSIICVESAHVFNVEDHDGDCLNILLMGKISGKLLVGYNVEFYFVVAVAACIANMGITQQQ